MFFEEEPELFRFFTESIENSFLSFSFFIVFNHYLQYFLRCHLGDENIIFYWLVHSTTYEFNSKLNFLCVLMAARQARSTQQRNLHEKDERMKYGFKLYINYAPNQNCTSSCTLKGS